MDTSQGQFGHAISTAFGLLILSSFTLLAGSQLIALAELPGNWPKLSIMMWTPTCLLLIAIAIRRLSPVQVRSWAATNESIKLAIAGFSIGVLSAPLLAIVTNLIRLMVQGDEVNHQVALVTLNNPTPFESSLVAMMIIIFIPVAEEILYRGVLFDALRALISDRAVVVLTAITFGIAHFDVANSIGTGLLGLGLGWLRLKSTTIWPCILLHAGFNLVGYSVILLTSS